MIGESLAGSRAPNCDGAKSVSVTDIPKSATQFSSSSPFRRGAPRKPSVGHRDELPAASGLQTVTEPSYPPRMPVSLISPLATFGELLDENSFSLGELHSHPLAAVFAPQFDAFQIKWFAANAARAALVIALGKANGTLSATDDAIDDFLDLLDRTLLIVTKNDRRAPQYVFYFGTAPVHVLKQPIHGEELATVGGFVPSLQASPHPTLAVLAPVLVTLVAKADAAIAQHLAADQALKDFDMLGGKKALIDGDNVLRQTVYGQLAAIPHANPTAMLPGNFADRFFRHEARRGVAALRNPKDVQAKLDGHKKKMEAAQKHLDSLAARAAQKAADKKVALEAAAAVEQGKKDKKAADDKLKELEKAAKAAKQKSK